MLSTPEEHTSATPPCPRCRSAYTSYLNTTQDGPVYLCSPCCEAFYFEPPVRKPFNVIRIFSAVILCAFLIFIAAALIQFLSQPRRDDRFRRPGPAYHHPHRIPVLVPQN